MSLSRKKSEDGKKTRLLYFPFWLLPHFDDISVGNKASDHQSSQADIMFAVVVVVVGGVMSLMRVASRGREVLR